MLTVASAGEVLAHQPGHEQQCGAGPVVGDDVLRLPGGVAGDQDGVADLLAADPGGVVLQEAVLAVRAGEAELLVVIERADGVVPWPARGHGSADRRTCAAVPPSGDMIYEGSLVGSRAPVARGRT